MKRLIKTLLAGACATGLLFASMSSQAADIRERTLRFAFQNVKDHPQGQGAQKFADLLAESSGGKIKVRLFPGGTLCRVAPWISRFSTQGFWRPRPQTSPCWISRFCLTTSKRLTR